MLQFIVSALVMMGAGGETPAKTTQSFEAGKTTENNLPLLPAQAPPPETASLIGPGVLTGHVFGATPGTAGETPLPGTVLLLIDEVQVLDSAVADDQGFFVFPSVPAGFYGLFTEPPGFEGQLRGIEVLPSQVGTENFLLGSSAPCPGCPFQDKTMSVGLGSYVASAGDGHAPSGVFADLNNDGFPELYLMRAANAGGLKTANQLFLNVPGPGGQRVFLALPNGAGAGDPGNATGAVAGDYDNDGDLDLYVLNFDQPNALLQNQWAQTGVLSFVDVTAQTDPTPAPGVPDGQFGVGIAFFDGVALDNSLTAAWADVDRDGDLDLYVGNHNGYTGDVPEGPFTVPGRRDVFYLNNRDGTFTDVTMAAGVPGYVSAEGHFETPNQRFSSTNAVQFADFNNDGWPDLLVTNKIGGPDDRDMLYLNLGPDSTGAWQGFATVTYYLGPQFGAVSGAAMGVDVADIDNDGDMDIYITDISGQPLTGGANDLWVNLLAETGQLSFVLSEDLPAAFSWGASWQDFTNDGFLDLHVATQAGYRDYLYVNPVAGGAEAAVPVGVSQVRSARGSLTADYNRDGRVDLFVVNLDDGPSVLYENNVAFSPNAHFLSVRLVGEPAIECPFRSTRGAIGAKVRVTADLNVDGVMAPYETQLREVVSGSGNAAGTSSLELEFGLGQATVAQVDIEWPSGRHTVFPVGADQFLVVEEASFAVDCNGNGLCDSLDIAFGISMDLNANGTPDECEPGFCPADLTPPGGNGVVNIDDLVAALSAFGPCPGCPEDITPPGGNGEVNIDDLVAVLNSFGSCP